MSDVTQILAAIEPGDPQAASRLLPLVYDELRRLAAQKLAHELPGQTLQPTALVHEAYLRLVGSVSGAAWDNRGHFFAAAAEAMRRILVENARRRLSLKRGGDRQRLDLDDVQGNAFTWCQERSKPYPTRKEGETSEDREDTLLIIGGGNRVLRGASFIRPAGNVRSAYRVSNVPTYRSNSSGFRPARTLATDDVTAPNDIPEEGKGDRRIPRGDQAQPQ